MHQKKEAIITASATSARSTDEFAAGDQNSKSKSKSELYERTEYKNQENKQDMISLVKQLVDENNLFNYKPKSLQKFEP